MRDEAIIEHLIEMRGIGRWTAQMLLIFRLGRPDVLPADAHGIRNGFMIVYTAPRLPTRDELERHSERWKPYRAVASWYMWRAVELAKDAAERVILAYPARPDVIDTLRAGDQHDDRELSVIRD